MELSLIFNSFTLLEAANVRQPI